MKDFLDRDDLRQLRCSHVWKHESIIQPGGRGHSTSWCVKCKVTSHGLTMIQDCASLLECVS